MTKKARVSKRVVNTKRHTVGYMIGKKFEKTASAVRMTDRGRVAGVRRVGDHLQAKIGCRPLSDLPCVLENQVK